MPAIHVPSYRKQKRSTGDLALVELEGVRHYLGTYDSPESREKYHQLLAEWSAGCAKLSSAVDDTKTLIVAELCLKFWKHAQTYYRKPDGLPTSELQNFKEVIRHVQALYAGLLVLKFGPTAFKAVRQRMVEHGLCRNTVNRYASRLKSIFKWGVEQEIVPASVWHGLQAVSGLRRGRTAATETDPVRPVPIVHVDAVKNHVSRQVRALVELQVLTGARPGELVIMRATDIETSGTVWIFRPADHKSSHHGFDREVYLGPQAQALVRNFMETRPIGSYLFSPIEPSTNGTRLLKGIADRINKPICARQLENWASATRPPAIGAPLKELASLQQSQNGIRINSGMALVLIFGAGLTLRLHASYLDIVR